MKKVVLACAAALISVSTMAQSVGLVLSGGGAKGIAHIGVIKALEDNNIPIDYITGTSMGAIVGGLYAAGYSPDEMMAMLLSKSFAYWSTGQIDENLVYYFTKPAPTPAIMNFNLSVNDSSKITANILPKSLINPLPMSFAFMELFAPYTAQCGGDFNKLFVPFRCVASDVYQKHKIVCASGHLGNAIRASMSFPIVFKPIDLDGVPAFDGGIYDNFPVDVMESDFAPDFILGVNVGEGAAKPDTSNPIQQIEAMIMQPQEDSIPANRGIKIGLNLQQFGLLDFPKANAIYQIGYDKAISMMDSIKSRINSRTPIESRTIRRNIFKSNTPYLQFDTITVSGASSEQNEYIRYLFESHKKNKDTISVQEAKIAYYRAISSNHITNLLPTATYNSHNGLFDLDIKADVKNNISVGIGGYISSSTNSMIYAGVKYSTLSFNSLEASIGGWIGQSLYAGKMNARIALLLGTPTEIGIEGVMQRQSYSQNDNLFFSNDVPTFVINHDNFIRLKYGVAMGRKAKFEVSLGYGYLKDYFYPNNVIDYSKTRQDEAEYNMGQVRASIEMNSLDNQMYPTLGSSLKVVGMGVYGSNSYMPQGDANKSSSHNHGWVQLECEASKYWNLNKKFTLGAKFDVLASTRQLLHTYTTSIVQAPAFSPTPATKNYFNPAFRANSFAAVGAVPIWKIIDNFHLRSELYLFMPFQKIYEGNESKPFYDKWFSKAAFLGEMSLVYNLSFASVSLYCNYLSYPARNWNAGISFGMLIMPPKFLR